MLYYQLDSTCCIFSKCPRSCAFLLTCEDNSITVYDRYCGERSGLALDLAVTDQDYVTMKFVSDSSIAKSGFKVKVTSNMMRKLFGFAITV